MLINENFYMVENKKEYLFNNIFYKYNNNNHISIKSNSIGNIYRNKYKYSNNNILKKDTYCKKNIINYYKYHYDNYNNLLYEFDFTDKNKLLYYYYYIYEIY